MEWETKKILAPLAEDKATRQTIDSRRNQSSAQCVKSHVVSDGHTECISFEVQEQTCSIQSSKSRHA
ncbi:AIF_HP2_G0052340.mRNA.1.CDS.1 [Saccharomyces cerevisiae]|nr:AIF_HP2_G0052340.mRNA.1.CDS.1 [Saccharomyces cerevisiae]CAI6797828.1 AIF_HP2_G0052340.mRNA.1.CDS.1 [Saccharomyces cerevisiae]